MTITKIVTPRCCQCFNDLTDLAEEELAQYQTGFVQCLCDDCRSRQQVIGIFKNYILYKHLGLGQTGERYLAQNLDTGQLVTLKVNDVQHDKDPVFKNIFAMNTELSQNSNYCLAPILESGFENGQYYNVSPVLDGRDLWGTLHEDTLGYENHIPELHKELIKCCTTILQGLDNLHKDGHIHGNIKLHNIIISPCANVVTMSDFGLNAIRKKSNPLYDCKQLFYQPPEQLLRPQYPKPAWDTYALGMVMYCIVGKGFPYSYPLPTGFRAIANGAYSKMIKEIICGSKNPKPIQTRLKEIFPDDPDHSYVSTSLAVLINRAICKDPTKRFQTAEAFLEALNKVKL